MKHPLISPSLCASRLFSLYRLSLFLLSAACLRLAFPFPYRRINKLIRKLCRFHADWVTYSLLPPLRPCVLLRLFFFFFNFSCKFLSFSRFLFFFFVLVIRVVSCIYKFAACYRVICASSSIFFYKRQVHHPVGHASGLAIFRLLNCFRAHAFSMKLSECLAPRATPTLHRPLLMAAKIVRLTKCLALQLVDNIC